MCKKSTKEFSYMAVPYVVGILYSNHKIRTHKIFNFLVMWIEIEAFIRKFIKRSEISTKIRNFTKWSETGVNIRNFTK